MKPLSIEIEGLRSFRSARRIDFSDLSLFAILGDTGAGKSSILEAIVYALFNGSTWDGRSVKDLMTTGAPRMRVRFEFAIDGVKYAVTRITPSTGLAIHLLECDEKPADRRDGEALVAKKLEELLKVKREEFFKTVVLPQGKFAALLEMSKGDRAKFLVDVLGLSILDEMNAQLSGPRTRLQLHTSSLRGKRSAIADDPLAALTEASDKVDAATEAETLLRKAVDLVAKEQQNLDEIGRRAKARNGVRSEIGTVPDTLVVLDSLVSSGERSWQRFRNR
jgi:exonuclease SbcC